MEYFRYAKHKSSVREMIKEKKKTSPEGKEPVFEIEPFVVHKRYSLIRSCSSGRTVGIIEDKRMFLIGDRVELRADGDGFIAPGITEEGEGFISRVRLNGTVSYGIKMDSGEFGYVTSRNIWKNTSESD